MKKLFGTDGVRGIAGELLTPELACALGKAGAYVLSQKGHGKPPRIIIGKDTRISGYMLEDGLASGILSVGGNVCKMGVLPTPGVAYLVTSLGVDCGVVISASHNPYEYNGIKFFNSKGFKLADEVEAEIEKLALEELVCKGKISLEMHEDPGRVDMMADRATDLYAEHLLDGTYLDLKGMKVVVDCANGAAYKVAVRVFEALGADLVLIGNKPNGKNINLSVGSTHPETLQSIVVKERADIGLAFDGDADRLIAVDEKGEIVDGDKIMYICAKHMKSMGTLHGNVLTATVMSNIGLGLALKTQSIDMQIADVGDRYVLELMQKTGSVLGGEQSGHIIFLDRNTTGDGVFAALRLIEAVIASGDRLSEAASGIKIYPQVLVNACVKNENKGEYLKDKEIADAIAQIELDMAGNGRVLIRPSGTEPLVRVMLEGEDVTVIERIAKELAALIEQKLS